MAQKTLTGIGECMIELSSAPNGLMRKSFAGDVFNTLFYADQASAADWQTSFYTGLGTDTQSDEMRLFLSNAGLKTDQILTVPDRVPGLYMIHLDGAERSFSYWRDSSAARMLASDKTRLRNVIEAAQALYISGITLAILPDDDAKHLIDLLESAKGEGKTVAFDPNIRPRLWDDPDRMCQIISAAAAASSLILPSFDDEQAAFGDKTPQDTIARYTPEGRIIVVKNGSGNVLYASSNDTGDISTAPVRDAVDTTGAGDSFNGAFLAAHLGGASVKASIKAGQTCAARVICHHGAIIS